MREVAAELNGTWAHPQAAGPHPAASLEPNTSQTSPAFDFGHAYDPARANRSSQPIRHDRHPRRRRVLIGLAVLAVTAAAALAAARPGLIDRDAIATSLGFGIEQVSLTGHRFTPDADLFDALDLKSARSLSSFDADAIRKRFERLPWVQSIAISRVWPGQLAIRVTERRPFAIWEHGDGTDLVDVTGRVLGPVKRDAELGLPRIAGEGANTTAAGLLTALGRYPAIRTEVTRALRLDDRRWTLELTGGGRIHLPSDGETSALARLAAEPRLLDIAASPGQIIDLRSPGQIAIRPAPAANAGGG